jgi:NAD-dependent DNA ligase
MTGTGPKPRKELLADLDAKGFRASDSVTRDTQFLICADPKKLSTKTKAAKKLGVEIISYEEFFKE